MKNKLMTTIFLALSLNIFSQDVKFFNQRPKRNFSIGIGGDGGVISVNHEKLNIVSYNLMIATEIGIGATQDFSIPDPNHYYFSLPFNISVCFGKENAFI